MRRAGGGGVRIASSAVGGWKRSASSSHPSPSVSTSSAKISIPVVRSRLALSSVSTSAFTRRMHATPAHTSAVRASAEIWAPLTSRSRARCKYVDALLWSATGSTTPAGAPSLRWILKHSRSRPSGVPSELPEASDAGMLAWLGVEPLASDIDSNNNGQHAHTPDNRTPDRKRATSAAG